MTNIPRPVYVVIISGSTGNKHILSSGGSKKLNYYSIKPGLTNTLGNFEIGIPDISGSYYSGSGRNPGVFSDVNNFDDIKFYLGYDNTGSITFSGKIETKKSSLDSSGYNRVFIGSDYSECLSRVLVNRGFVNESGDTIIQYLRNSCTGSTTGGLSSSNDFMVSDTNLFEIVSINEPIFESTKKIADESVKDFYVDNDKKLHYFNRQSETGSETFSVGTNILEYTVTEDLSSVKNDIYVFGIRIPDGTSGSDLPTDHDLDTENRTSYWTGSWYDAGSPTGFSLILSNVEPATGSNCLVGTVSDQSSSTVYLTGSIFYDIKSAFGKSLSISDNDVIHIYYRDVATAVTNKYNPFLRLYTDNDNFFECPIESFESSISGYSTTWQEKTITLGTSFEGIGITGSHQTSTGSYKWKRYGNPDWLNINTFEFRNIYTRGSGLYIGHIFGLDGFYIGTKFQGHKSGSYSIETYGLRRYVSEGNYNSFTYCDNVASSLTGSLLLPIKQVELTTTGSYNLSMGKKYLVTIPADSINDYLELIDLEHTLDSKGALSTCILTDKKEIRTLIPTMQYFTQVVQTNKAFEETFYNHHGGSYPILGARPKF